MPGMAWLSPLVMHSMLSPGMARFQNVADGDIAAHGRAIRDYLVA